MLKPFINAFILIHKMLLSTYEDDIKQISSGSTGHNNFWLIFADIAVNWKKLG